MVQEWKIQAHDWEHFEHELEVSNNFLLVHGKFSSIQTIVHMLPGIIDVYELEAIAVAEKLLV